MDPAQTPGKSALRAGWTLSGLALAFFAMDGAIKLFAQAKVAEASAPLGWPSDPGTIYLLAALLLGSALLYAIPRTAMLGAILLTGYLGGAVATHVRVGSPLLTHALFGVYLGIIVWGGLWFRDPRLRALIPLRG
jgi:hypothetical protein